MARGMRTTSGTARTSWASRLPGSLAWCVPGSTPAWSSIGTAAITRRRSCVPRQPGQWPPPGLRQTDP
eukprot:10312853-Lingulodinium_polyedra.AAC.1